jgi:hypothetical protein
MARKLQQLNWGLDIGAIMILTLTLNILKG